MADWDELAGEKGRAIPTGRMARLWKMGALGLSVSASVVARKVGDVIVPRSEGRRAELGTLLRTKQAEKVLGVLGELKGASMKIGQMLSADPELVPPEFASALANLQHNAPPMTWTELKSQIETAFDQPIEAVYREFDPDPLGAASIGQVHRAVLHSGEEVAVKVQYPNVAESLDSDIRNLSSLMTLGRLVADKKRLNAYLKQVRDALHEESDYRQEAENLTEYGALLAERDGVSVPRAFPEWTRKTVITMELVQGTKIDEALCAMPQGPARTAAIERFVRTYMWMVHERLKLHADPHPGNFLIGDDGTMWILDFGSTHDVDPICADGILEIMDACWERDDARALRAYQDLGFGREGGTLTISPTLLREYHELILEPFLTDREFDFGAWKVRVPLQRFMMRHPSFLRLVPPVGLLMPARVLSGVKGLLAKTDARLNIYRMARETAAARGKLTSPL